MTDDDTDNALTRATIPPSVQRILDTRDQILGDPDPEELRYLHSILAQCALPYREPKDADGRQMLKYRRRNGRAELLVTAGEALNPLTRRLEQQGVPYGAKPRLLFIHLCSEAIRTGSREIEIERSMTAFMQALGLKVTGGRTGSITGFKDQLNRLSAATLTLVFDHGDRADVLHTMPISRMEVWFPKEPGQAVLWPSIVELSADFYQSLRNHALPLDMRAVRALQHNARALDVYMWLTHRLPRVRGSKGDFISWYALRDQFGVEVSTVKRFHATFKQALRQATAVYPEAKIEQVQGGFRLYDSPPPVKWIG